MSRAGWVEPHRWPDLEPGEIHLWFASLETAAARLEELTAYLNDAERARAARFVQKTHRQRYAAGRGLLREMLGRYLGTAPASVAFAFGPLGKPYLHGAGRPPRLQFNYADTGGLALFGFALDAELGVDLESEGRVVRHVEIARRHFRPEECAALRRDTEDAARAAFLACWTRKEAWGKARGLGIRYPLNSIDLCSARALGRPAFADPEHRTCWRMVQLYPAPGMIGAVCYEGEERRLHRFVYPKWQT